MSPLAQLRKQQPDPAYAISTKVLLDAILELTDEVARLRGQDELDEHRTLLEAMVG